MYELPKNRTGLLCDLNECSRTNPFVQEAVIKHIRDKGLNRYSDPDAVELTEKIAEYVGVKPENVLTFPGCDVAIDAVVQAFPGTWTYEEPEYGYFVNTYGNYPGAMNVYLSCPNNPTGGQKIVTGASLILLDEAYTEFETGSAKYPQLVKKIVFLRSFSKAFGLADIRLGYAVSTKENIDKLRPFRKSKNVSGIAQVAGISALDSLGWMHQYVTEVNHAKRMLYGAFDEKGIRYTPSYANFILCENLPELEGITVRKFPFGKRVTVGGVAEAEQIIQSLDRTGDK